MFAEIEFQDDSGKTQRQIVNVNNIVSVSENIVPDVEGDRARPEEERHDGHHDDRSGPRSGCLSVGLRSGMQGRTGSSGEAMTTPEEKVVQGHINRYLAATSCDADRR